MVPLASGLIAGEAICGLLWAGVIALSFAQQPWLQSAAAFATRIKSAQIFDHPAYLAGVVVMALLAALMMAASTPCTNENSSAEAVLRYCGSTTFETIGSTQPEKPIEANSPKTSQMP